jgi:hypothetical protein
MAVSRIAATASRVVAALKSRDAATTGVASTVMLKLPSVMV